MSRALAVIIIVAAVTLISEPFLSGFGPVAARISLPCIIIVGLVTKLRPYDAVAAAIGAGLVTDMLGASFPIAHTALYVLIAAIAATLGDRIFSHLSLGAYMGLNTIMYVIAMTVIAAASRLAGMFSGTPVPSLSGGDIALITYGLAAHLAAAAVVMFSVVAARRIASPFILIHHGR